MKQLTAILTSLLLVLSLAACGNRQQAGGSTMAPSLEPENKTELQFGTAEEPKNSSASVETERAGNAESAESSEEKRWLSIIRHQRTPKRLRNILRRR